MNAARIARIVIVTSGVALATVAARPCRAQAEINPDHYEDAPTSAPAINAAAKPVAGTVAKATRGALQSRNLRVNEPNSGAIKPAATRRQDPKRRNTVSAVGSGDVAPISFEEEQDKVVSEKQPICCGCSVLAGAVLLLP